MVVDDLGVPKKTCEFLAEHLQFNMFCESIRAWNHQNCHVSHHGLVNSSLLGGSSPLYRGNCLGSEPLINFAG